MEKNPGKAEALPQAMLVPVVLTEDVLISLHCGVGLIDIAAGPAATVELLAGLYEVHVTLPCRQPHQPAPMLAVLRSLCMVSNSAIATAKSH